MTNPTPFFVLDFFATEDVTLPRLQKFSVEAIQRLTLDNPDKKFDDLIQRLTTYHEALFGAMVGTDAGLRQRHTEAQKMWGAVHDLQHQLAEDEDLLEYKSKKTPAIHEDFFPHGRREYTRATLLTAELLLTRAKTAAATHATTLGAEFDASLYAGFLQAFIKGRAGTGAGDDKTDKARAAAHNHRQDLTQGLTEAVKLVAAHWLRDAARAAAYFRFELLLP